MSAATINEIRIDEPSTDNNEYVELVGTANESLNNLSYIVIGDGAGGSGVIESVTSLAGQSIPSDGIFVFSRLSPLFEGAVTPDLVDSSLQFENSDNVTHLLVSGFTGAKDDDLDTDDDLSLIHI